MNSFFSASRECNFIGKGFVLNAETVVAILNSALSSVKKAWFGYSSGLTFLSGILVRDEASRNALREQVGEIGLIL